MGWWIALAVAVGLLAFGSKELKEYTKEHSYGETMHTKPLQKPPIEPSNKVEQESDDSI